MVALQMPAALIIFGGRSCLLGRHYQSRHNVLVQYVLQGVNHADGRNNKC